ncbi:MAG TPA: c-type cytochrome domain-containing protein, partial [Verrucomicrobiae bacterium]|nr:c-type cytochrome domain-containing protein [Verrucomicrobiae bacterium]
MSRIYSREFARRAIILRRLGALLALFAAMFLSPRAPAAEARFSDVAAIFSKHCLDCHAAQDPEANLVMESFDSLMKGGESGPVIIPGKSSESLLVRMIEGAVEKDRKKQIMPPGKREKLSGEQISLIREWIDQGAKAPAKAQIVSREIDTPKIAPRGTPRKPINAIAASSTKSLFALAFYNEIELRSTENRMLVRTLRGSMGPVNALAFSADGNHLFSAGGESGLPSEIREWNVSDGSLLRTYNGHRDAVYGLAISPDGKLLASGSYDQKIRIWSAEDGKEVRALSGHNGCVYALAFRADGKILASASGDRTVKLWDVETGERRDTLSQPLKELFTVAFSPDGKQLVAGGVDNRIRLWSISEKATETSNPLLLARFGHEGAILKLAFSPDGKTLASSADDRTVKLWNANDLSEKLVLPEQPDWPAALAFLSDKGLAVGRLDGTHEVYDTSSGKPAPLPKPQLARIEPRGIERGVETKIKLTGKNLNGLTNIAFKNKEITAALLPEGANPGEEQWALVTTPENLPRGSYEFSVASPQGESDGFKLYADDVPQLVSSSIGTNFVELPAGIWGVHAKPGDQDTLRFQARRGETLIFDFSGKSIGSKADGMLTVKDAQGQIVGSNHGFDGSTDPFLAQTFLEDGIYSVEVGEQQLGGSQDHFYRLTIGELPYVTAVSPLAVGTNTETEVELIGANIPPGQKLKVVSHATGENDLPLDPERYRTRRTLKLLVADLPSREEKEPNDTPEEAMLIETPVALTGRFWSATQLSDPDYFKFHAKAGEHWIIETLAAQRGSPADTKIEILDGSGKPVQRVLLQAVRDSAITFRGIDSTTTDCRVENWQEMELNEFLYLQGEVVKLFRAPQGPDSGFLFYSLNGKRHCYFDTSATAHPVEEACYTVEPHAPGTHLAANGLPVFPLYYANDDDGERKLGTDSKVHFTPPADGDYIVRVSDSRGYSGERYLYSLLIRPARPDFKVTLSGANPTVNPGSGQSFSVSAERIDRFDGEIKVEISGLPPGFVASS